MRSRTIVSIGLITLTTACGGKLVAEQPFSLADGKATLAWEITVPEGEASLWLDYELATGVERDVGRDDLDPRYQLQGLLKVTSSGNPVYDGSLWLRSDGPPTSALTTTVTIGSSKSCGASGCEISGRVHTLDLSGLAAGSPVVISAALPLEVEHSRIEALKLQLRSK